MKKESAAKVILIPAISLFIICAVCAGLLALTNDMTKDKIAEYAVLQEEQAKMSVAPDAAGFSEAKTTNVNGTDYVYYEALDNGDALIGYVFSATSKGYGGDLTVMVGISCEGLVTGVKPTAISETPGLGMKAQSSDFLVQYTGKSAGIEVNKNEPGDNEIRAITGATITSRAVTTAVNAAFEAFNTVKEVAGNG